MGGCRCSYKNCVRATKNSEKDFHFFHYPVRDPERCTKWITNARKPNFQDLPDDQLRNKVVCQLHFELQYFTNTSRKRLVHNAVPTLDAGSEDPKAEEMMNVQVLQSDSEGTVFTVDTDNLMHSEIRDVKSYVIKNGNLVPADLSSDNEEVFKRENFKIKVAQGIFKNINDVSESEPALVEANNLDNNPEPIDENITKDEEWLQIPNKVQRISPVIKPCEELQDPLEIVEESALPPTVNNVCHRHVKTRPIEDFLSKEELNARAVVDISKTIQQHSKEIASIKRLLKIKMNRAKVKRRLTNSQIISSLRGVIPPSLCGAISLHLFKRDDNFTKDEKNFLIDIYKASPAVYEILSKDCKWRLPDADIVKKLLRKGNCIRQFSA